VLVLGFVFMGMVNGGVIINISAQMTDAGHTAAFAATVLSVYMFTVIIGKISLGVIYDRFGLTVGTVFGSIVTILGTITLLFSSTVAGPFIFAVLFGFGTCLGTVAPPIMVVNEFGKKDLGFVVGLVTAFEMLGAAIAAPLTGAIADKYSTYAPAWIILSVVGVIMLITLAVSVVLSKKLVSNLEAAQQNDFAVIQTI
jgi:MFS family permease